MHSLPINLVMVERIPSIILASSGEGKEWGEAAG
jgi:hypothetical protein